MHALKLTVNETDADGETFVDVATCLGGGGSYVFRHAGVLRLPAEHWAKVEAAIRRGARQRALLVVVEHAK